MQRLPRSSSGRKHGSMWGGCADRVQGSLTAGTVWKAARDGVGETVQWGGDTLAQTAVGRVLEII